MKTISVTQTATEKFAPDTTVFEVKLVSESKKHAEAVKLLHDKTEAVAQALAGIRLEKGELTSSGAAVSSMRRDGKISFCGRAEMKITLPVADERIGEVIEALEKSGAEWTQSYILADNSHKTALIQKAVKEAREVASSIATASGVKLGALSSASYASQYGGGVRMLRAASVADIAEPEQIEAAETVTCEWEIL